MKNVIITGSSSGFGLLAAKHFADHNYKVYATMRASQKNEAIKKELEAYASHIKVVDMDVATDASVNKAMESILAEAETVDVLVNNAGIMHMGIAEAFSVEQANQLMNVNYYGIIRTTQAVLPSMRQAGQGLIINTTSSYGRVFAPFAATYGASKAAVEAYTQSLKYELAPTGVEAVIVEPGPFATNLAASFVPEARTEIVAQNSDLQSIFHGMMEGFATLMQSQDIPAPTLVAEAYLDLAEMPQGSRPTRTVVGLPFGADQVNQLTQPIQDGSLKAYQMEYLLETKLK
ncbi:SDR family oxidoreductase [Psychroserpens damuponensis]|uniref:SDR family oxidoreductase n=1 Tax=Psychroserpens damuponensis TaxID=943936 RepID=UPI0005902BE4|nr:SDR family oxidoreductase [Psychroserpens damuponensis]